MDIALAKTQKLPELQNCAVAPGNWARMHPTVSSRLWRRLMKKLWICGALLLAISLGASRSALAQSEQALPLPDAPVATDIPGARELPDPNITYKVVFDIGKAAPKVDDVNPALVTIARYFNTLAKYGVPADHRKFVVVFHQGGTEAIVNNATFKARNDGHDNPNIALIRSMKKAGIDFRVCGQAVLARKIDPETVLPEIQLDLWAMTTITNLELRGYIHMSGN
jgi:intracellular sulfur oxidation DsrE/DsrF family protein